MAKRKNKGGGMSGVRKWAKKILSGVRVAVIVVTAGHGVISTASNLITGATPIEKAGNDIVASYTGYFPDSGTFDKGKAVASALTIGGGLVAAWLIGIGIKHI